MNIYTYLTTYTEMNSKWIIDLEVKAKLMHLLDENRKKYLQLLDRCNFLDKNIHNP